MHLFTVKLATYLKYCLKNSNLKKAAIYHVYCIRVSPRFGMVTGLAKIRDSSVCDPVCMCPNALCNISKTFVELKVEVNVERLDVCTWIFLYIKNKNLDLF